MQSSQIGRVSQALPEQEKQKKGGEPSGRPRERRNYARGAVTSSRCCRSLLPLDLLDFLFARQQNQPPRTVDGCQGVERFRDRNDPVAVWPASFVLGGELPAETKGGSKHLLSAGQS
ncbi:hypothetical protein MTO96_049036 [Rhipicephalus appendiculatus]